MKQSTLSPSMVYTSDANRQRRTVLLPTGFIVTGPNISSQELLFNQLSSRLKQRVDGPTVLLRSGDSSNLKAALKQIIRDATNQKDSIDDEEGNYVEEHVSQSDFQNTFADY